MYYKLACTNVKFDSTYENNIRFESRADQQSYFNVENLMANAPVVNFRIGTLLNARAVLRADETAVNAMLYNYCIVEDTHEDANIKYLYYFIKKITFDVSNQIIMDLELDVIQTFYIDCTFEDCIINRAHLDRWTGYTSSTYIFNAKDDSKLFEREEVREFPKYISKREKIKFIYDVKSLDSDNSINDWLYNHVQAWVYIYMLKGDYKYINTAGETSQFYFDFSQATNDIALNGNSLSQPYTVFAFPIYTGNGSILVQPYGQETTFKINQYGFNSFEEIQQDENNTNTFDANVLNIKVSPLAPLPFGGYVYETNYIIDDNENLVIKCPIKITGEPERITRNVYAIETNSEDGLIAITEQELYKGVGCYYNNHLDCVNTGVTKEQIKANSNSKDYNPKMFSADFKTLTLSNSVNTFSYDFLKLSNSDIGTSDIPFFYFESFSPDVTRTLCVYDGVKEGDKYVGFYGNAKTAMIGLVGLMDLSMPFSKNQLDIFLANNKNFYLQRNITTASRAVDAGIGIVGGGILMASTAGAVGKKQLMGGLATAKDTAIERIQSNLTLDNMANAPESVSNASGNSAFYTAVTDCGIYYEIRECIDNEAEQANDIIRLTGFSYGRIDNVKNVDNIRVNFNYVQADIQEVNTPYGMNDEIKNRFRQIFAKGVRLWNKNDNIFNESASNYEVYLNE